MLHIGDHFEEDLGIDFDQVQPDTLLISHLVGLGRAHLLYSQKSSGPYNILHHPLRDAVVPKSDENVICQYHDLPTENRARSRRTQNPEKSSDAPNSGLGMSHWNDLIPINRRALFRESRRKREKEEKCVYDQDKEDRRRRRELKNGKGGSANSSRQEMSVNHRQASVSIGAHPSIQNASQTPKLMYNEKEINSPSVPRFEASSLSLPVDTNELQRIKIHGVECLADALPEHDSVVPNTLHTSSLKSRSLGEPILTSINGKGSSKKGNSEEVSLHVDDTVSEGRVKIRMLHGFVEEQLRYISPTKTRGVDHRVPNEGRGDHSQTLCPRQSSRGHRPVSPYNLQPLSALKSWTVSRNFESESLANIQIFSQEHQDDEDTASEEGQFEYALMNSDIAEARDQLPSESKSPNAQDISDLSESMSTCAADKTDWEISDDNASHVYESASLRTKQIYEQADGQSSTQKQFQSAEAILVNRLMSEFWVLFNQNWRREFRHHGSGASPASGSVSNSTSSDQASHTPSNRKRARGKEPEDPEDNDRRASKRAGKQPATETVSVELQYACPYRKYDPRKYCVQDWKLCAITSHKNVARVKAHLYNYHTIHQCPRCKQLFDTAAILEIHALAPDSCQVRMTEQIDGITSKIKEQLQCRKKAFPG